MALVVSAVVLITVMVVILKRSKAKTTDVFALSNRAEATTSDEPMYENVTGPLSSITVYVLI